MFWRVNGSFFIKTDLPTSTIDKSFSCEFSVSASKAKVVDVSTLYQTVFLLIIFGNRKRWNRGIVNGMQHFLGLGRTGRVFHLFPQRVE